MELVMACRLSQCMMGSRSLRHMSDGEGMTSQLFWPEKPERRSNPGLKSVASASFAGHASDWSQAPRNSVSARTAYKQIVSVRSPFQKGRVKPSRPPLGCKKSGCVECLYRHSCRRHDSKTPHIPMNVGLPSASACCKVRVSLNRMSSSMQPIYVRQEV